MPKRKRQTKKKDPPQEAGSSLVNEPKKCVNDNAEDAKNQDESNLLIPEGHLPSYLADAFGEVYEEDGLMVMGRGLGCMLLLACFVRFYADTEEGHAALLWDEQEEKRVKELKSKGVKVASALEPQRPPPRLRRPLVVVLSLNESERRSLVDILESWGTPPKLLPTMITNEAGQAKDREMMYAQGGVFCITSRILITDMLTNVVSANQIDGMLVFHAHNVTEESTEAFILRIFHSQKQPQCSGFVKGFSEVPEALLQGFGKVDKVLKALRVRRLYLYPRFQETVRQELEGRPPAVTELFQPLSPLQKEIQHCMAAAVQACLRELKQQTTNKIEWNGTDSDLSIENCVTANFDRAISRQLEPEWHKLSPSTKQLVQDLKTLRTLFQALLQYDCVTFFKLLNNIKSMSAASRHPSLWLLTPAADRLFRKAKERVYRVEAIENSAAEAMETSHSKLVAVLEENPKWKLLRKVLDEIKQGYDNKQGIKDTGDDDCGPCTVLVMVKDDRTLDTVKAYLTGTGKRQTLALSWLRYLEQQNDRSRALTAGPEGLASLSAERRLLLEEEGRTRRLLFGEAAPQNQKKKQLNAGGNKRKQLLGQVPSYLRKRRRVATEKGRGDLAHQQDDLEREAVLDDAVETAEHDLNAAAGVQYLDDGDDDEGELKPRSRVAKRLEQSKQLDEERDEAMFRISTLQELRIMLKSFGGNSSLASAATSSDHGDYLLLLQDVRPTHVVFYDMDVAFIRSLETYASLLLQHQVKAYFLVFEASAEEKIFKKALEKEQNAFERLIHHKMTMPPPMLHDNTVSQELQQAQGSAVSTYMDGTLPLAFDSRRGQGKADAKRRERRDIAVDVREFRAALPSILHQGGMRLAPVTLTVGDFVLSDVHCVERKSISDLFGSFASGRLYTQAEAMCRHYKEAPCLLIEFDPQKSFCLQNPNELGLDIRTDSVCTKLALLCMHFPLLRILWSKGPHETVKVFQDLKRNHKEVDVDRAVEVGRSESIESLFQGPTSGRAPSVHKAGSSKPTADEEEEVEDEVNEAARDMLLRLPGMTVQAARRIMQQVDCLKDLVLLDRKELRRIAGPVTGQKLFTFFRQQQTSDGR